MRAADSDGVISKPCWIFTPGYLEDLDGSNNNIDVMKAKH